MTINLSLKQCTELSSKFNLIPIYKTLPIGAEDPISIFEKLALDEPGTFLLESAEQGIWSRYSFVGVNNRGSLVKYSDGSAVWKTSRGLSPFPNQSALDLGDSALDAIEQIGSSWHSPKLENLPPLTSGLVGMLAWDLIREIESLPDKPPSDYRSPIMSLSMSSEMAIVDHHEGVIHLLSNAFLEEGKSIKDAYQNSLDKIEGMRVKLASTKLNASSPKANNGDVTHKVSKEDFFKSVAKAKEYVRIGDVFQVVLSQRFDMATDAKPLDIYRNLRALNPSPYMYFLNFEDEEGRYAVVGSSPEALVTLNDGHAEMHPIAGSRPRGESPEADDLLAQQLIADHKERAEHLMLVDLARNDLLKVCKPDSVHVSEFMQIHKFSHIMHLNSTVEGELLPDKSPVDVFRATFPAGTLSGAPKPRALEIIDELEPANRGLYAGVVGYFDFLGNADLAIAIRTAFVRDGVARVQAGAGIVLDSMAESEYQETISKASAPLRAIETCSTHE